MKLFYECFKKRALLFAFCCVFALLVVSDNANAALISNRSLTISDSRPLATNVTYTFIGDHTVALTRCIELRICTTPSGVCVVPVGVDTQSATRFDSKWTGGWIPGNWTIDNTTNGVVRYTNSVGEIGGASYEFSTGGLRNPSVLGLSYSRINTYTDDLCTFALDNAFNEFTIASGNSVSVSILESITLPEVIIPVLGLPVIDDIDDNNDDEDDNDKESDEDAVLYIPPIGTIVPGEQVQEPVTQDIGNNKQEDDRDTGEEELSGSTGASAKVEEPPADTVGNTQTFYERVHQIVVTEEVGDGFRAVTVVGILSGIIMIAGSTLLPLLFTSSATGGLSFASLGLLGFFAKKRNDEEGTVFEVSTQRIIPGAKIKLSEQGGTRSHSVVTNAHGRYGFLPTESGIYKLAFAYDSLRIDPTSKQSKLYGSLYSGEAFSVDAGRVVSKNIAATSTQNWSAYADKAIDRQKSFFRKFLRLLLNLFFYGGFVIVIFITFFNPITFNIAALAIYAFFIILQLVKSAKRSYGIITSKRTKEPIPFAIVSLYGSAHDSQRKAFAVTDVLGRYFLLTDDGHYHMKVKGKERHGNDVSLQNSVTVKRGVLREDAAL